MIEPRNTTAAWIILVLTACSHPSNEGLVARAGGHELAVDRVVNLLVDQENLPAQAEVVRTLAELWIDYTLLGEAAAEDTGFASVELERLVGQQVDRDIIGLLRDSVIQVDTIIAENDLRRAFESEAPVTLRARHILLGFPDQATETQKDSVRLSLERLRERALAGEPFASLAEAFSQDPGSARNGGDLGEFGRGDMVRPFEEAALALNPDEISDVVESPFGLHVIQLISRSFPDFGEVRDEFRVRLKNRRVLTAESTFVAGLEDRANPRRVDEALLLVREMARNPGSRLSRRASERPLVEYDGGAYTVGELQHFLQTRAPQLRSQIEQAMDAQLESFLQGLVQRELLADEARGAGLAPPTARTDSLVAAARQRLKEVANEIGVLHLEPAPGEPASRAVARAVDDAMEKILTGARDVVPLGQVAFQLRERYPVSVFESGIGEALLQVSRIRAGRGPAPSETVPAPSAEPADTTPS